MALRYCLSRACLTFRPWRAMRVVSSWCTRATSMDFTIPPGCGAGLRRRSWCLAIRMCKAFASGRIETSCPSFVSGIRTLNLGIQGDGPLTMLATLREFGPILKPGIVLWCFFEGNDLGDLIVERQSPLLRRYLTFGFTQRLFERQD